jgi:hypothetical protein
MKTEPSTLPEMATTGDASPQGTATAETPGARWHIRLPATRKRADRRLGGSLREPSRGCERHCPNEAPPVKS